MTNFEYEKGRIYREAFFNDGVVGLEKMGLKDHEIIGALMNYCVGREYIIPQLKKAGWSVERFKQAEIDFGLDKENIDYFVNQFEEAE
jgi:hypothetical protein